VSVPRRTVIACGSAALALALGACGVPIDSGPKALARNNVPFGLLRPSSPTTTTPSAAPVTVSVVIYLVAANGQLSAVAREVPVPAPLTAILGALVDGPTNAEAAAGLQSAVPSQTQVISASVAGGIATVDLGGTFAQLVGTPEIEAVAQIVFTATALPGVGGVSFELNGQQVAVPTATGAEVPVAARAQFAPFAPSSP
jgi:spore germination protein GerM